MCSLCASPDHEPGGRPARGDFAAGIAAPPENQWLEQRVLGYFGARPCASFLRFSRLRWCRDVEEIR